MRDTVAAFARAIGREADLLADRPDLTWQQLANRLLTEPAPVPAALEDELAGRSRAGATPWLRRRSRVSRSDALVRELDGGLGWLNACAMTADAALAATAGANGSISLFDARIGEPRRTLRGHAKPVNDVDITADGRMVASASDDDTVAVWDARTGALLQTLEGHGKAVQSCRFTAEGALVVSGSSDGSIRVWDWAAGTSRVVSAGAGPVAACAVTADGTLVAGGDAYGDVRLCRLGDGHELWSTRMPERVASCCFTPNGEQLVVGGERTLTIWRVETGDAVATIETSSLRIGRCACTRDGSLLVIAEDDGRITVFRTVDLARKATFQAHAYSVEGCALSGDGALLLTAGGDQYLRVWDLTHAGRGDDTPTGLIYGCAFSADGALAACAGLVGQTGVVRVYEPTDWRPRALEGHDRAVSACRVAPDGSRVLTAGMDGTLRSWEGDSCTTLAAVDSELNDCAIPADGTWVVAAANDGSVLLAPLTGAGAPQRLTAHTAAAWVCAADPAGAFAVSGGYDQTVRLWSAPDGAPLGVLRGHAGTVLGCDVAAGGAIASSGGEGTVRVWDPDTQRCRHVLEGHGGGVDCCAWTPDGRWIVSGGADGDVLLWDAARGTLIARGSGHAGRVRACAPSPDGRLCATTGADAFVRVWALPEMREHAAMPLGGGGWCVAFHPAQPLVMCGGEDTFAILELVPSHA
jgi:WD40 repeat protein